MPDNIVQQEPQKGHPLVDHAGGSLAPWHTGSRDGFTIYAANGRIVAEINRSWFVADPRPADARQIAAAPDLLAALEDALAVLDDGRVFELPERMAIDSARAAIARAGGAS